MSKSTPKTNSSTSKKRQLKAPKYKSFKVSRRIKSPQAKLPSVWKLWKTAFTQLGVQKRVFLGITLVYAVLIFIFVRGLSGGLNAVELKENLDILLEGSGGVYASSVAVFGVLLGSASATDGDLAGLYQTCILVIASLAYIWALRQTQANNKLKITIRDAFYDGCAPIIPFLLVIFVMSLQLMPVALANLFYSFVIGGGFAATPIEKALWYLIIGLLVLLSLYMISSSIFATYIVTLPDTRPMQALRAARELVRFRRWEVLRKVIVLPIVMVFLLAIVTLPSILIVPGVAEWIFFVASLVMLPLLHSYMYALYRALL